MGSRALWTSSNFLVIPAHQSQLPNLEMVRLLCQLLPPHFLLEVTFRSRSAERFNKGFDPGSQRLYCFFVDRGLLGEL